MSTTEKVAEIAPSPIKLATSGFIFKKTGSILEDCRCSIETPTHVPTYLLPPLEDDDDQTTYYTPEHVALNICVTEIIDNVLSLIISRDLIAAAGYIIAPKVRDLVARVYGTTFLDFVDLCNKFYWGVGEDLAYISRMVECTTSRAPSGLNPKDINDRLTRVVGQMSIFDELCAMCGPGCRAIGLWQRTPIIEALSAAIVRYLVLLFGVAVSTPAASTTNKPKSWVDVVKTPVAPFKPTPSAIDPDDLGDDFNEPCPDDGCDVYGTTYYV